MPETIELAQKKADEMFNGNFSIYLTYLINKDNKEIQIVEKKEEINQETKDTMDSILDM